MNGTDPERPTDLTDRASMQEEATTSTAIRMALRNHDSASIWARVEAAEAAERALAQSEKETP